jgi:hypothetical protein
VTGYLKLDMMALPVFDDKADERYHRQHKAINRIDEVDSSETFPAALDTSRHPPWP